ncbi:MAG: NAD-dependent epimerase/dehydratase family protein [Cyclobacteriaceae bacterium]|nr:NAD-dependent epimerase/dehydratase family protein [Cyclobacteriaceae bacterium]
MNILVTGATGFIGANLSFKLAESGHDIHAFCRSHPDEKLSSHKNIKIFRGDITNKESICNAMRNCVQVYHLAAYTRVLADSHASYYKVNVGGTINVLECAIQLGVKKLVYTSAGGVLGPSQFVPLNEDSFRLCPFFNNHETSKHMAEEKVKDYVIKGLKAVIVNPGRVFGPGILSKTNSLSNIMLKCLKGKWHIMPGDGTVVMNYVYIEDVVNGHIKAMEHGKPGERYILGGANASYIELFRNIWESLGKKDRLLKLPFSIIRIYAAIEVLHSKLYNREPDITPTWVNSFSNNMPRTSEKAINELGYSITPFNEAIQKTLEWLKKQNLDKAQ